MFFSLVFFYFVYVEIMYRKLIVDEDLGGKNKKDSLINNYTSIN
jgi:hypothetical protein